MKALFFVFLCMVLLVGCPSRPPDNPPVIQPTQPLNPPEPAPMPAVIVPSEPTAADIHSLNVEVMLFDDRDVLKQVRSVLIDTATPHYKIIKEDRPNQKGFVFELRSHLTPISLSETIKEALKEYKVSVNRKQENLLVITPE